MIIEEHGEETLKSVLIKGNFIMVNLGPLSNIEDWKVYREQITLNDLRKILREKLSTARSNYKASRMDLESYQKMLIERDRLGHSNNGY